MALLVAFTFTYLMATEYITMLPPRSDILLFQRGHLPSISHVEDEENGTVSRGSEEKLKVEDNKTTNNVLGTNDGAHLLWTGLTYGIKEGKKEKVILNGIDGWVKPGTLTALMVCIHHFLTPHFPSSF